MIAIHYSKVIGLQQHFSIALGGHATIFLARLQALRLNITDPLQRRYIDLLIRKGAKLITAAPDELTLFQQEFDRIMIINPSSKQHRAFKNQLLTALGYKERRSDFYPSYFARLGIKACVYCNSQLCITAEKQNTAPIAKFQVDHFYSKNVYPCLSIALFNLYPVCASCNNIKGIKTVGFNLYTKDGVKIKSPYTFSIVDLEQTVIDYLSYRDPAAIKLLFGEPAYVPGTSSMDSVFSIKAIYETQKDLVEELILKAHIYNEEYKLELENEYSILFPDRNLLDRMIVGNYVEDTQLHQRPLSKFMQDIARQLELI